MTEEALQEILSDETQRANYRTRLASIWSPLALGIALILGAATLPFIPIVFDSFGWRLLICKILQIAVLYCLLILAQLAIHKWREGSLPWEPFALFAAILCIHLVAFIAIYPGGWRWDDLGVLRDTVFSASWPTWQNYLTAVFYMLCLITIPMASFIVFAQTIIISAIASYIAWRLRILTSSWLAPILLVAATVLPPILNLDLYPLRSGIHSWLEILIFFVIADHFIDKREWTTPQLVLLTGATAIVCIWRTECIIFVAVIPILLLVLQRNTLGLKKLAAFTASLVLATTALGAYQHFKGNPDYALTAYAPSLSAFAHQALEDKNEAVFNTLEEAYDVKVLESAYEKGVSGEDMYWNQITWPFCKQPSGQRDSEYYTSCRNSFIAGALAYPGLFLETRFQQFNDSTGSRWTPYTTYELFNKEGSNYKAEQSKFDWFYSQPLNDQAFPSTRNAMASYMEASYSFDFLSITYNLYISAAIYLLAYIVLAIRKPKLMLLLLGFNLHHVVAFLTAPAYYFMYYYSFYLGAILLLVIGVWSLCSRFTHYHSRSANSDAMERS